MDIMVVSGFLGAGKTTFILEFIKHQREANKKFAILINEFGDLPIDGDIVRKEGLEVIELPSGCICCSLRASLPETIDEIFEKIRPDVLLIEPSGLATPLNVLDAIKNSRYLDKITVKPVLCIVDASAFQDFVDDFGKFYLDQIRTADIILINKIDTVSNDEINKIEEQIKEINPNAIVVRTYYCRFIPENGEHTFKSQSEETELIMESLSIIPKRNFRISEIEDFLNKVIEGKFGKIIRAKGFVECDGMYSFQISGKTYDLIKIDEKFDVEDVKITPKAVFIGSGLKVNQIKSFFES